MKTLSFVVVLACIGVASCFNAPDPAKLKCTTKAGCPTNYVCSNEKCVQSSGAGGANHDASIGAGGIAGGGGRAGSVGGGGQGDGTASSAGGSDDAANPDAPSGLPNGSACQADGDCAQSHCLDGVCCESTCGGCKACSYALTGQDDGKCAAVASGVDPHDTCADETATSQCGSDGTCDGNGACRKVGANHVCADGSCSSDGKTFTPATTCDGKGACTVAVPKSCGQFQCAVTGCLVTCDPAATTSPCDKGSYCDTTAKVCTAQKPDGQPATQASECASGILADGVCCHDPCTGCNACTATLNGQAASTTGQCLPVKTGGDDPHKTCTAAPPCGLDGKCDGSGACRYPALNASCAADSCTGSTLSTSVCDSSHKCTVATSACPNSALCASASACKTGCTSSTDCASGNYCASGTCKPKLADGGSCAADGECQNGHCISGICCATTCGECNSCSTGTCKASDNGKTCGSGSGQFCNNGTCGACADGSNCNPNNNPCQTGKVSCSTGSAVCQNPVSVADGTPNVCGAGKVCKNGACATCADGSGCTGDATDECHTYAISCSTGDPVCKASGNKANTTPCGPGKSCTGGKQYDQATCNNGVCGSQPITNCPSTGCNGTSCASACTSSQKACGTGCCNNSTQYCSSGSSTCGNKINSGSCPDGNDQCTSGNCSSGICCPSNTSNSNNVCCASGATGCGGQCCSGSKPYCLSGQCVQCSSNNNCTPPQTCGGGGTSNTCGCSPICTGKCGGDNSCGSTCPNTCATGRQCNSAGTHCDCSSGTDCSGTCTNLSSDPANCGACGQGCSVSGQACKSGKCCTPQSSRDLITGAGFDTAAALGNWYTGLGGTSWSNADVEGCASGSISFSTGGSMNYCFHSATAATYYLGMKGKGSVGCIGQFYDDTNCVGNGLGPDFLNLAPTDSASWQDAGTVSATGPSGTRSILINCFESEGGTGAIDQIFLNQGSSTGFGG